MANENVNQQLSLRIPPDAFGETNNATEKGPDGESESYEDGDSEFYEQMYAEGEAYWKQVESELSDEDFQPPDPINLERLLHKARRACGMIKSCSLQEREQRRRWKAASRYQARRASFVVSAQHRRKAQGRSRAPARRRQSLARSVSRSSSDGDGSGPDPGSIERRGIGAGAGTHTRGYGAAHYAEAAL